VVNFDVVTRRPPCTEVFTSTTKHGPSCGGFSTVTSTGLEPALLPPVSVAVAVSACGPLATAVVFHGTEYGAFVTGPPSGWPSR
jgi:hypothetical protein